MLCSQQSISAVSAGLHRCKRHRPHSPLDPTQPPASAAATATAMPLAGEKQPYGAFDVENMQPVADQSAQQLQPGSSTRGGVGSGSSGGARRRCCSWPVLLAAAALACSLLALAFGIYAAVAARRLGGGGDQGAYLTTDPTNIPRGWRAASLYKGTGYFAQQQPMLYARSDHKTVPIGSKVYLLGGLTNALEVQAAEGNETAADAAGRSPALPLVLNATVVYDTATELSKQLADMPQPRFRFCSAVLGGQLYVIGGMANFEPVDSTTHVVSDRVMRYTPRTDKWELLPGRLNHPRADCCAAAVGGKIYVAGGWTTDYADTLGSVEVFDPSAAAAAAAGGWSFMPNMTLPRGDCEAVELDDSTFLVLGGVVADGNFTASVEALDVKAAQPSWSARASMARARGDFAAEALPGGRVIVMGGETSNGTATEKALHDVEEYNKGSNRWVMKAPLPEARFRFDTAHVGERVFAFGGHPTCSLKVTAAQPDYCIGVALDTVWAYVDVEYPDVYAVVKENA